MVNACCAGTNNDKSSNYPLKRRTWVSRESRTYDTCMAPEEDSPMLENETEDFVDIRLYSVSRLHSDVHSEFSSIV